MNIVITKQTDSQFQEDEKRPAKPILTVKNTIQKNYFLIIINHPNRTPEGLLPVLYQEEHMANDIFHAIEIGKDILAKQFSDVVTKYEEIKYIPAGKKGKMAKDVKPTEPKEETKKPDIIVEPIVKQEPVTNSKNKELVKKQTVKTVKKDQKKEKKSTVKKAKEDKVKDKKTVKQLKTKEKKSNKKDKKNDKSQKQKGKKSIYKK